jgi:hypothetical protein
MVRYSVLLFFFGLLISQINLKAQLYRESSVESIFSFSDIEKKGVEIPSNSRFTLFFNFGQNFHYDFSNVFGLYSGFGIRNIGFITEESDTVYKRRTYALGVPLALKLGSFNDNFYFFGGGEYELFFHYKQKQIIEGNKIKQSEWFSQRTKRFAPSFFVGIQFPVGINLKFKYYPFNFLNTEYKGNDFGEQVDYSEFNKTQIYYFSLSFIFRNKNLKKYYNSEGEPERIAFLQR